MQEAADKFYLNFYINILNLCRIADIVTCQFCGLDLLQGKISNRLAEIKTLSTLRRVMKLDTGKLLGIIQILLAVWYFDWHNWTQIIISVLLVLNGTLSFLTDTQSKFLTKSKKFIQIVALTIVVILLIKLYLTG